MVDLVKTAEKKTDEVKSIYQSKTMVANVFMLAAAFIPGVKEFIASNPEGYAAVLTISNMVLRWVTTKSITL